MVKVVEVVEGGGGIEECDFIGGGGGEITFTFTVLRSVPTVILYDVSWSGFNSIYSLSLVCSNSLYEGELITLLTLSYFKITLSFLCCFSFWKQIYIVTFIYSYIISTSRICFICRNK